MSVVLYMHPSHRRLCDLSMACASLTDACASIAVYQGPQKEQEDYSLFTIQDPKETFRTIQDIRQVLEHLQEQHVTIGNSVTAQYGSL